MIREGDGEAEELDGAAREPAEWNTPVSDALLVICALAGIAIVLLSFATWMDITFTEEFEGDVHTTAMQVKGIDSGALTTFGDGYLTAFLGVATVLLAGAYRLAQRWAFYCAAGLAVAGLSAFLIALYNLVYDRATSGPGALGIIVLIDVSRTPELWILTGMALVVTVAAFVLLALAWRNVAPDEEALEAE
jgi:hypothetical protein